ncbi:MAG: VOC family protein [Chloroflexota bacterium]|nr:VOC family protein [Chloroflexota bacterium]
MQQTATSLINRPAWVDLATPDADASREFYSKLFGWEMDVSDDPQYGGYATGKIGDRNAAGIGPKQSEQQPTAWSLYIGTDDADALARQVTEAGGTVIQPPLDVGDQGRFAVFQDPAGAVFAAWQAAQPTGFTTDIPNGFGWAELNARGVENAIPFYERVFGWTRKTNPGGDGAPAYTEFQLDGQSILGAWEMNPSVPAEVPSYWLVYFNVDDVDAAFQKALDAGAQEVMGPQEYPGGRFAILTDPHGATFGLLKTSAGQV